MTILVWLVAFNIHMMELHIFVTKASGMVIKRPGAKLQCVTTNTRLLQLGQNRNKSMLNTNELLYAVLNSKLYIPQDCIL